MVLDGATGTQLQLQGLLPGVCFEKWCLDNPKALAAVQTAYQKSGSDILYTATFGANRIKLAEYGIKDVRSINKKLASITKAVAGKKTLVAGDIGPCGKFIEPFGDLAFEDAVNIFKEQVRGLLDAGVDLFVIETMIDIQEARAALIAVKEMSDLFTVVTMTYEKDQRTLNGTDPVSALITLQSLGADAVGSNCSTGPKEMLEIIKKIGPFRTVPLVAKPNAGLPKFIKDKTVFEMDADSFASYSKEFIDNGVAFIGGCCGTTPDHIKAVSDKVSKLEPKADYQKKISALSSARSFILLDRKKPMAVIGECINPTGKKDLQLALRENNLAVISRLANEQRRCGATLLDVNVGMDGVDEKVIARKVIGALSVSSDLPLVIDSADPEVVGECLRFYPGRALINSISGENKKTGKLLKLAAKYGAMFILLPLTEKGIPKDKDSRVKVIVDVINRAKKLKFSVDDMVIDAIALTVSSRPEYARQTLETIRWVSDKLEANTVIGLSNISFGLPRRDLINSGFLAMARSFGLSMVIANPMAKDLMDYKRAADVLLGADKDAAIFLSNISQSEKKDSLNLKVSEAQLVSQAIIEGNRERIVDLIKVALNAGFKPETLVQKYMITAITDVGELFDRQEYFLPQLIASAETMKKGFSYLKPLLLKKNKSTEKETVIILATVKGDVHDIGKNIVALMLQNHGLSVIDLGRDVSSSRIIKEIKKYKTVVVGLSALMTTTMVNMKDVINCARKENLGCKFIIGGAVVTKGYARLLGAEYAKNGVEAVRVVKKISC
ncbi:MAG: homocysteine S-methyltransferase family protein [Candidatus Omnitrophica bacterium]|nr:homocysteine S-methyltransferase family protein [Candidatus Omnitrophota bacterium]